MLPRDHYLKQAFQDLVHFPNGFEKGGLSDIQARLIRKNGVLINALCVDEVSDPTSDDLHILKVIASQSAPKSPVEQAWVKYLSIVKSLDANSPSKSKSAKAKVAKPADTEPVIDSTEKPAKTAKVEAQPAKAPEAKTAVATPTAKAKAAVKEKAAPAAKASAGKADTKKEDVKKADSKKSESKKAEPAKGKAKA